MPTLSVGAALVFWATPAAAGVTEAKTGQDWGARGFEMFLEASKNCRASPGSLPVHLWGPEVKESGMGEGGGGYGHMLNLPDWPCYPLHIHTYSFLPLLYLQFLFRNYIVGFTFAQRFAPKWQVLIMWEWKSQKVPRQTSVCHKVSDLKKIKSVQTGPSGDSNSKSLLLDLFSEGWVVLPFIRSVFLT